MMSTTTIIIWVIAITIINIIIMFLSCTISCHYLYVFNNNVFLCIIFFLYLSVFNNNVSFMYYFMSLFICDL